MTGKTTILEIKPYWVRRLFVLKRELEHDVFMQVCEELKNPTKKHHSLEDLMNCYDLQLKPFRFEYKNITVVNGKFVIKHELSSI